MSEQPISSEQIILSYQQAIDQLSLAIGQLKKTKKIFSFVRLAVVFTGLITCWFLWPVMGQVLIAVAVLGILFIYLVFRDADTGAAIKNHERRIYINRHEIDALQQNLNKYDDGHSFADPQHPYASDLDLFGPSSLFQYISRCHADQSKKLLADYLKEPQLPDAIQQKQEAVQELAVKQAWCQQFQSMAMANPLRFQTEKRLNEWMDQPPGDFEKPFWKWLTIIYPLVSISLLGLFLLDYISTGAFSFCLIGFFGISSLISSKIQSVYALLSLIQPEMDSLYGQLNLLESEKNHSAFLISLQHKLKSNSYPSAASAMNAFRGILKRFDIRLNLLVFFFLNAFFLWDLRQIIALTDWKNKNKPHLNDWFSVIAEMEVTISLASLFHNQPNWVFPAVDNNFFQFSGESIGHPLIPVAHRITNDFNLSGTGKMALITGSNMAGKSTFLRALGINAVLALMGAPVCARHMKMSDLQLISSMRVADNLSENTSTFYAELKKLEYIIAAVNRNEKVFILLDEVLRGTNSDDRHKGSQALVRQLLKSGAVGIMATHDTDLAHTEAANPSVTNYYFEGKIVQDELYFDYKIKKGVCESLNASILMKKIGIHFQD